MAAPESDAELVTRIRGGDESAWSALIERYQGRLLAFVESRLGRGGAAEDVVQETFVGFLTSLPNYDGQRGLESYLFSICAFKLTDHLRRGGRRPALALSTIQSETGAWEPIGPTRPASSLLRSDERRGLEAEAIAATLREEIDKWRRQGAWTKLKTAELLFVRGWPNQRVALALGVSEQQVANTKSDLVRRLRLVLQRRQLPADVFPELQP